MVGEGDGAHVLVGGEAEEDVLVADGRAGVVEEHVAAYMERDVQCALLIIIISCLYIAV